MVKNPSSSKFNWQYKFEKSENYKDPTRKFLGKGDGFLADYCPDQKKANDTSDYLWYMTRYDKYFFFVIVRSYNI